MATATIVLSSSPSRSPIATTPPHVRFGTMLSSSPLLPSPSQLISNMPAQLPTGSNAAHIPKGAMAEFASASSLLRQTRFEGGTGSCSTAKRLGLYDKPDAHSIGKTCLKTPKAGDGKENEKAPMFRKPKCLLMEEVASAPATNHHTEEEKRMIDVKVAEGPAAKKPRKRKGKGESKGQAKIKKTRITKPGTSKPGIKSQRSATVVAKQAKGDVRETFNTILPSQEEDARAREEFRDLCLDKAIPLRRQWTPCKDTVQDRNLEITTNSSAPLNPIDHQAEKTTPIPDFGQLLGDFGLAKKEGTAVVRPAPSRQGSGQAVLKKRKIEVVEGVPAPPKNEKPTRTKSPKKKPQTITEKATAPFGPVNTVAGPSLLQYFSTPEVPSEAVTGGKPNQTTILRKDSCKVSVKKTPKSQIAKSKTKTQRQPVLLSPESAMKNIGDQDLMFGTSSQLAREESPSFIKDLEIAMEESATMSQDLGPSVLPGGRFRTSNSLAPARPRNLWSVASRDFEGSLLEADTVDLTETPKPSKTPSLPASMMVEADVGSRLPHNEEERCSDVHNIIPDPPKLNIEATPNLQQKQEPDLLMPRSVAEATLRKRPNNRCPVKNATNSKDDPNQMPNYQGCTDAQLSKEVAAYGFKSIKKRVGMITLLEKCWEAKVSMAIQEVEANLNAPQPVASVAGSETPKKSGSGKKRGRPPKSAATSNTAEERAEASPTKKPRGRPRKDASAATSPPKRKKNGSKTTEAQVENAVIAADEIYDSNPPTPAPPRQRSSSRSQRQLQLSPSGRASRDKNKPAPKGDKVHVFAQITKSITTFPPTHDPKNMTFYEKMLIFEPVVLEDLAAWLNTEGLSKVGEDDEVWPGLVKEWCEENSVCCLWRENLRGGIRGRW